MYLRTTTEPHRLKGNLLLWHTCSRKTLGSRCSAAVAHDLVGVRLAHVDRHLPEGCGNGLLPAAVANDVDDEMLPIEVLWEAL